MRIKASGRSALILATGLWVCCAGPSQAATTADSKAVPVAHNKYSEHVSHHLRKVAHHKSSKIARKYATPGQAAEDPELSVLPPWVANANAQLASADTSTIAARAMTARANIILQAAPGAPADAQVANTQVVSADQVNDVDRALHESPPPVPPLAIASADRPAPPVMASVNDNSVWDKTSLIGKVFMAFGVMLTMASAARMFMT